MSAYISEVCRSIPFCEAAQTLLTENSGMAIGGAVGVVAITLLALRALRSSPSRNPFESVPSDTRDFVRERPSMQFALLASFEQDEKKRFIAEHGRGKSPTSVADKHPGQNRYGDIKPNDANRVTFEEGEEGSYFNASWVLGRTAIACQGPLPTEISKFWKMVAHTGVKAVVNLVSPTERSSRGTPKCSDYYSKYITTEEVLYKHGELQIVHRELENPVLEKGKREKTKVHQYHLLGWPDHDVVSSETLAELVRSVRKGVGDGKILVHCSAGVGRTGTFLAAYEAFRTGSKEIYHIATDLRSFEHGRTGMIQSGEQYRLALATARQLSS